MAKVYTYIAPSGKKKIFKPHVTPLCMICAHREQISVNPLSVWCRKLKGWRCKYECKWFNGVLVTTKN